ncbi:hypothetical protein K438DRAFT_2023023 [Mycena galopus ATCC 62051]|nr:hypothetical protein K438DRAFT_2023023 [Mycena galopus ATCC 62051]
MIQPSTVEGMIQKASHGVTNSCFLPVPYRKSLPTVTPAMTSVAQLTLPMFLGTVLNWVLFAIFLVQVCIYFSVFSKDQGLWKLLVIVIVVSVECVETFAGLRDMVKVFGVGFGSMDALDDVGWAWFSSPIIAGICQFFYGWRIYILGHNPFVFALIILISAIQLGAGVWSGVIVCIAKKYSLLQSEDIIPTALWLAATSTADLIIAFGTIFYLKKSRGDPEFTSAKTNSLVSRLVQRTAETGSSAHLLLLLVVVPTLNMQTQSLAVRRARRSAPKTRAVFFAILIKELWVCGYHGAATAGQIMFLNSYVT